MREGVCWNNYLASTTKRVCLEAGISSFAKRLIEEDHNGFALKIVLITKEELKKIIRCEAVKGNWISQRFKEN
jgi:hypothetical protein